MSEEKTKIVQVKIQLSAVVETTIAIEKDVYDNMSKDIFLLLAKAKVEANNWYIPWTCDVLSETETEI